MSFTHTGSDSKLFLTLKKPQYKYIVYLISFQITFPQTGTFPVYLLQ